LWQRQIASYEKSQYLSMPPMIVGATISLWDAGADWEAAMIGAFNLADGEEMWRFVPVSSAGELGAETWARPKRWSMVAAASGPPVSVDRRTAVVLCGGNPAPDFVRRSPERRQPLHQSLVALT